MTSVPAMPLDLSRIKLPRNKFPFEMYQALQYLTIDSEGSAVQWLTLPQLQACIRPNASAQLTHAEPPPGAGTLPAFAALRIFDRLAFLQSMAKVESERLWGQKSRAEREARDEETGGVLTEEDLLMLADKFRSQASRHGFVMGHTFGLNVVSLTSKTWKRSKDPPSPVFHYENWTRAPGRFDPFIVVFTGDADTMFFQPGATVAVLANIKPKTGAKAKSSAAAKKQAQRKPDLLAAAAAVGPTAPPRSTGAAIAPLYGSQPLSRSGLPPASTLHLPQVGPGSSVTSPRVEKVPALPLQQHGPPPQQPPALQQRQQHYRAGHGQPGAMGAFHVGAYGQQQWAGGGHALPPQHTQCHPPQCRRVPPGGVAPPFTAVLGTPMHPTSHDKSPAFKESRPHSLSVGSSVGNPGVQAPLGSTRIPTGGTPPGGPASYGSYSSRSAASSFGTQDTPREGMGYMDASGSPAHLRSQKTGLYRTGSGSSAFGAGWPAPSPPHGSKTGPAGAAGGIAMGPRAGPHSPSYTTRSPAAQPPGGALPTAAAGFANPGLGPGAGATATTMHARLHPNMLPRNASGHVAGGGGNPWGGSLAVTSTRSLHSLGSFRSVGSIEQGCDSDADTPSSRKRSRGGAGDPLPMPVELVQCVEQAHDRQRSGLALRINRDAEGFLHLDRVIMRKRDGSVATVPPPRSPRTPHGGQSFFPPTEKSAAPTPLPASTLSTAPGGVFASVVL